jgi:transposase
MQLSGWMRHRYELVRECTQRKNKLIAISDELFPELTRIFHDPTRPLALAYRERFPTPQALATASWTALVSLRVRNLPSNAQLVELQGLARDTIGTRDLVRQQALVLEQQQLIRELHVLQEHEQQLDCEILQVVEHAREGQILTSIPGIGPIQAAAIIAAVGNILNFHKAAELKAYFGWAPKREQSGVSLDRDALAQTGCARSSKCSSSSPATRSNTGRVPGVNSTSACCRGSAHMTSASKRIVGRRGCWYGSRGR